MAHLTELPWLSTFLLTIVGLITLLPELSQTDSRERLWKVAAGIAGSATLLLPVSLSPAVQRLTFLHTYYALIAWLITATLVLSACRAQRFGRVGQSWKILAAAWAFLGEFIWLGDAYMQNRELDFYLGALLGVILLILIKLWFRLPTAGVLVTNTLILVLCFLPLADLVVRPSQRLDPQPDVAGDGYLYETAKRDAQAFNLFWNRYLAQYDRLKREMSFPDAEHKLPYRVRTNIQTSFFQSRIRINNRGYRGRDISVNKGESYRIVALGESNTFGFTLDPKHKPWPELLEEIIHQRLHPQRTVEVINTGLPNHGLEDNLHRLRTDILSVQPDMIISYHGWNGFPWLYSSLPPVFVKHLPDYKHRPLWLLAECEYRLRLLRFKRSLRANPVLEIPPVTKLVAGRYGIAYGQLAGLCRTNGIRLVIANYSMAVNRQSDAQVIEFYRAAFPAVYPSIQVNVMHSKLIEEIVRQNPEVQLANTHAGLDGEHRKFIDLVHFAPEGDQQMAESIFSAITNILQRDLTASRPSPVESPLP